MRKDQFVKLKTLALGLAFLGAGALLTMQNAMAARIYNELYLPIKVTGSGILPGGPSVTVQPGSRSDSIDWTTSYDMYVNLTNDFPICVVGRLGHADLQGGNYLVVSQSQKQVTCTLCDSNHNAISKNVVTIPDFENYNSQDPGC
jgi:hypothetical protein